MKKQTRIGVIGAGILGSSIATHLARAGADVVVFEKEAPSTGATRDSFAWINATFDKIPFAYFELNRLGARAWRDLERELSSVTFIDLIGVTEKAPQRDQETFAGPVRDPDS